MGYSRAEVDLEGIGEVKIADIQLALDELNEAQALLDGNKEKNALPVLAQVAVTLARLVVQITAEGAER